MSEHGIESKAKRAVTCETPVTAPPHPRMRLLWFILDSAFLGLCTFNLSKPHTPLILLMLLGGEAVILLCCLQVGLRIFRPSATARRAAAIPDAMRERLLGLRTVLSLGGAFGACASLVVRHVSASRHDFGFVFIFCMFGVTDALNDFLGERDLWQIPRGPRQRVDWNAIQPIRSSHWGEPPHGV